MLGETVGSIDVTQSGYIVTTTLKLLPSDVTLHPEVTIFHIHLISTSGGGAVLLIANGQGGTTRINATGTTSKGIDFDFGVWGITFPLGAYVTVDGNISNAVVTCKAALA